MRHILIDYENIQPTSFQDFSDKPCHIWLFLGVHQQKHLPLELVESLLAFDSDKIHIVKMQHMGKNALDFCLSFYLGKISEIDDDANVCILARDSGYDVLIDHVNLLHDGINITRISTLGCSDTHYDNDDYRSADHSLDSIKTASSKEVLQSPLTECDAKLVSQNTNHVESVITPTLVSQCHAKVLDIMLEDNAVLPKDKPYLQSCLKNLISSSHLSKFTSKQQDEVVKQVTKMLVQQGVIEFNTSEKTVRYFVSQQDVLSLIADKVSRSRAKDIEDLNKVIKQNLASYRQQSGDKEIKQTIAWLKAQNIIRQDNKNIHYPALDGRVQVKAKDSHAVKKSVQNQKQEASLYQRALNSLKERPDTKRPAKRLSLRNYLISHFKEDTPHAIDNTANQLIANKIIVVSDKQTLSYKL